MTQRGLLRRWPANDATMDTLVKVTGNNGKVQSERHAKKGYLW